MLLMPAIHLSRVNTHRRLCLSGRSALAQRKYLSRHNGVLKKLFFEQVEDLQPMEAVPPWYSPTQPKPHYQHDQVPAYWDVLVYADHTEVQANGVDAKIVDKERKTVTLLDMSCPWTENRKQKDKEKTRKYSVRPTTMGNQEAAPRLQDHSNQYYNECAWRIL